VIATEKKSSSILIDESMLDKVSVICPNIGIVYSGMGPDFRVLVAKARKSAQAYWKVYGEYPPARVLTQEIANVMQQATHSGCVQNLVVSGLLFLNPSSAVFGRMAFRYLLRAGTPIEVQAFIRWTLLDHFGRGKLARLERTW
jgi:hypothetical protein